MVDSISGAGGPQNISQTSRVQNNKNAEDKRAQEVEETKAASDEVQISDEALTLQAEQAAEHTAKETRTILEEKLDEALSNERERVDKLL